MAVYVDDMYLSPLGQFGNMRMSHMIADTSKELLAMARKIGVQAKWIQKPGTKDEHFDICMSKREKAIECGAIPVGMRKLCTAWGKKKSANDTIILDI